MGVPFGPKTAGKARQFLSFCIAGVAGSTVLPNRFAFFKKRTHAFCLIG
jgi:hypothetical protein